MSRPPEPPVEPPSEAHRTVRFELAPRTMVTVGLGLLGIWLLGRLVPVLLVLVAALMIVGSLNPVVAALERRKFGRGLALGLVFGLAIVSAGLGLFLTVPSLVLQVKDLVGHEPEIRARVVEFLERRDVTQSLADSLRDIHYADLLRNSRATLLNVSVTAFEIVAYGVAAVFLALYIMLDHERLRGALFTIVPRAHHIRFSRVLLKLETIVGGYVRGQIITGVLIGAFVLILLLVCRVPHAVALAALAAVLDVLPYIGAVLTIAPIVAAAYLVGPGTALTVFLLLVVYEEFESRILVPHVYGRTLRLPPSVVFFALLAGGTLAGILGALLALPLASALLMLMEELRIDLPGETEQPEDVATRKMDEKEEREYKARTEAAPIGEASAVAVEIARERTVKEAAAAPPAEK